VKFLNHFLKKNDKIGHRALIDVNQKKMKLRLAFSSSSLMLSSTIET
jgi:hypothetical protein